jgi:hypothetical protein
MVRNFRPISIFNNFSKIFEFITYENLCRFLSTDLILLSMASVNIIPREPVRLLALILLRLL